jgi:hypothetical protein
MQLLGYVYLTLFAVVTTSSLEMYMRFMGLVSFKDIFNRTLYWLLSFVIFVMYCMSCLLLCTLTNFIKFHLRLILDNYTTIENLEREEGAKSKFDIGRRRNWEQVFGQSPYLWWLTFHTQASRPVGDGVRWRVHYARVIDEDDELLGDDDGSGETNRLLPDGPQSPSHRR